MNICKDVYETVWHNEVEMKMFSFGTESFMELIGLCNNIHVSDRKQKKKKYRFFYQHTCPLTSITVFSEKQSTITCYVFMLCQNV